MEPEKTLAEAIYEFSKPEDYLFWGGCNSEPEYLCKHMASADACVLAGIAMGRVPTLEEVNAIEEVTYVTIGFPECWKKDNRMRFIKDSRPIDIPDEILSDSDLY
jgi:hypothetical protein